MTNVEYQLVALERERKHLESILEGNSYWTALRALDQEISRTGGEDEAAYLLRRETLLAALGDSRIFQVHTRVVEVIALLRNLDEPLPQSDDARVLPSSDDAEQSQAQCSATSEAEVCRKNSQLPASCDDALARESDTIEVESSEPIAKDDCLGDVSQDDVEENPCFGEVRQCNPLFGPAALPVTIYPAAFGSCVAAPTMAVEVMSEDMQTSRPSVRDVVAGDIQPVLTIRTNPPEGKRKLRNGADKVSSTTPPDDLTQIRGIRRDRADDLIALGVTQFEEIADWTAADVRTVRAALSLGKTISQQNWIEQAAVLAAKKATNKGVEECVDATPTTQETEPNSAVAEAAPIANDLGSTGDNTDQSKIKSSKDVPSVTTAPSDCPVDEGLMAISSMTPKFIQHLTQAGIRTLSQLAGLTGADLEGLDGYIDLRRQMEQSSWIEQAAILATGQTTRHLRRQRHGDFKSVVARPVLQPTRDSDFAKRLAELVAMPVEAEAIDVTGDEVALEVAPALGVAPIATSVPHLRIVGTTPDVESENVSTSLLTDRDLAANSEKGDNAEGHIAGIEQTTGNTFAYHTPEPAMSTPQPFSDPISAPEQNHTQNGTLLADSMKQMADSPLTGPVVSATVQTNVVMSSPRLETNALADFAANDDGVQPADEDHEPRYSEQVGQDTQWSDRTFDRPSEFEHLPSQAPDFRAYVADSLTHVGPIEADVAVVAREQTDLEPLLQAPEEEPDRAPLYAPVFLQPEFIADAVDDLPGTPQPGDAELAAHAVYQDIVQEASVKINRDGDNTPHITQQGSPSAYDLLDGPAASLMPKAKIVFSSVIKALTRGR